MIRDGHPVHVQGPRDTLTCTPLIRQAYDETPDESWLQAVLDQAPELLPIADIDDRLQPRLFSLGREVATPAGPSCSSSRTSPRHGFARCVS
jgi:hypothetical protein